MLLGLISHFAIVQTRVRVFHQGLQTPENNENQEALPELFVVSSVSSHPMKHDEKMFELASQTSIPIGLLHVCFN